MEAAQQRARQPRRSTFKKKAPNFPCFFDQNCCIPPRQRSSRRCGREHRAPPYLRGGGGAASVRPLVKAATVWSTRAAATVTGSCGSQTGGTGRTTTQLSAHPAGERLLGDVVCYSFVWLLFRVPSLDTFTSARQGVVVRFSRRAAPLSNRQ